jgi:pimeloyl-ACP methyl ester carboxylesterase
VWAALWLPAWLLIWRGLEARIGSEWLLRLYGFTEAQADGRLPELEARLQAWAELALAQLRAHPCDEVLVVGHSTGGMLAVDLLDRMLAAEPELGQRPPRLALLTLGHCMPILAGLDHAKAFRAAPADWAAFARVGPWPQEGRARRRQVSPRFHQSMSEAGYRRLLQDRPALHLHYLRPQERSGGYDVVALTAGPTWLSQRLQAESPWSV